jgi:hypothetical protein
MAALATEAGLPAKGGQLFIFREIVVSVAAEKSAGGTRAASSPLRSSLLVWDGSRIPKAFWRTALQMKRLHRRRCQPAALGIFSSICMQKLAALSKASEVGSLAFAPTGHTLGGHPCAEPNACHDAPIIGWRPSWTMVQCRGKRVSPATGRAGVVTHDELSPCR